MYRDLSLISLLFLALICGCQHDAPPVTTNTVATATLTVLPQPQQTIKGWGCYPCTYQPDRGNPQNYNIFGRPRVQRLLLHDLGISFMRCNILPRSYDARRDDGSLDTHYLDATLVRHLKMARGFGMTRYLLTVWSPPAIFKDPPVTQGFDQKTHQPARLKPEREAAYCRYVVSVLDYITKQQGLAPPYAYSIQNEPGAQVPLWDGVAYDTTQWQRVFKAMRAALDAGGYKQVLLIGPEAGSYESSLAFVGGANAPALGDDQALAGAMAGFAYHGYSASSELEPGPQQMRAVAQKVQALGKDVWMTEWCVAGQPHPPLEHAFAVMQRFGREMAYIPTNYWTWWQGWWFSYPKDEVLITGEDDRHLHISKTYYILQKLWHSAPPGSVVKLVSSTDAELKGLDPYQVQTVAFAAPAHLTVLIVNPTAHKKLLTLNGLRGTQATVYRTDEKRDMARHSVNTISGGTTDIVLPPRCILLVVTNRGSKSRH